MSTEYWRPEADEHVREMAGEIIAASHPDLATAKIVYLFRNPPAKRGGQLVLGTARKASPMHRAICPDEPDFIVELAWGDDAWCSLNTLQRRALLDHELCHCVGEQLDEKRLYL